MDLVDDSSRPDVELMAISVPAAGKALGIGRSSAYAAVQRGEIPTIRIGGRLVVPLDALRQLLRGSLDQSATTDRRART